MHPRTNTLTTTAIVVAKWLFDDLLMSRDPSEITSVDVVEMTVLDDEDDVLVIESLACEETSIAVVVVATDKDDEVDDDDDEYIVDEDWSECDESLEVVITVES